LEGARGLGEEDDVAEVDVEAGARRGGGGGVDGVAADAGNELHARGDAERGRRERRLPRSRHILRRDDGAGHAAAAYRRVVAVERVAAALDAAAQRDAVEVVPGVDAPAQRARGDAAEHRRGELRRDEEGAAPTGIA